MKRFLHTHTVLLIQRLAMLYIVAMLCRVVFMLYNTSLLGSYSEGEVWTLLCGALKFDTTSILYINAPFILLALLPLRQRTNEIYQRVMMGYYMVVNSLMLIGINMADVVYFHYTQKRFTADEVFFADNSNSVMLVGKFMAENWYLVLVWAFLTYALWVGYRRKTKVEEVLQNGWAYYLTSTVILLLGAGLTVGGMRGGFTRQTRPITLSNATLYTADNAKANLILSNPFCILRTADSESKITYTKYFSDEELPTVFNPTHMPVDTPKVLLKGHNVVVFIMESMSAEHSAHLCPDLYEDLPEKGFTPFLDSLMREGLCFRKMYANGTRSIQAMPSVLGSMPSFKTPFVLMPQALGESRQLPALLRDMGYKTSFFCGSEHGSMGFGAYARQAGVDLLFSREDYEKAHGKEDFDGYWGIWDEPFLQFAGEEFAKMQEPFFSSLFTLSSHHPFVVPDKYKDTLPKGYTKIHKGVAYDDEAFRKFFHRFENEEWFKRTIFVFVADHVSSEKFAERTKVYPGNYHILSFIYTPDLSLKGEVMDITQQLDLMPTILGLVGNQQPYFAFGRDLLNEPLRPHWSVSYDGKFRALMSDDVWELDDEPTKEQLEDQALNPFKALLQQYYGHLERQSYVAE